MFVSLVHTFIHTISSLCNPHQVDKVELDSFNGLAGVNTIDYILIYSLLIDLIGVVRKIDSYLVS